MSFKTKLRYTIKDYGRLQLKNITENEIKKEFGFSEVEVTYADKSVRNFDINNWFNLRERIVKNLFDKKLCTIKFK